MSGRSRVGLWLRIGIAFVVGFLAGLVVEFVIGSRGQTGLAVGIAGALAISASCLAAVLPELFTRGREHNAFLREHADLLNLQVYSPIQSTNVTIIGQQLTMPGLATDLMRSGFPDWGYRDPATSNLVPVSELSNWNLGRSHFESDPELSSNFGIVWARLTKRISRKQTLDNLSLDKVGEAIRSAYGPGFIPAWNFTLPEPQKWFNAPVIVNWLRSGHTGFEFTEQIAGNQHRIIAGSMMVLTSDGPFGSLPSDFTGVMNACRDDVELRSSWQSWMFEDAEDRERLSDFFRLVKHSGERIQATHEIHGQCELCSG